MSKVELFSYEKGKYQMLIPSTNRGYIDITYEELVELEKLIYKEFHCSILKNDIKKYCEKKGISLTEGLFEIIFDNYLALLERNSEDDLGLTKDECLEETFEEYPFGDVLTDTVWEKLKVAFDAETSGFRFLMEELDIEVPEEYNLISNEKWQEIKKAISEMDNYDLVDVYEWLL